MCASVSVFVFLTVYLIVCLLVWMSVRLSVPICLSTRFLIIDHISFEINKIYVYIRVFRFTEIEAAKLLRPLLESVAYLHDLGIVHRYVRVRN